MKAHGLLRNKSSADHGRRLIGGNGPWRALLVLVVTAAFLPMLSWAAQPPGSVPYAGGTTFTVWAPHASQVYVSGTFNQWSSTAAPLTPIGNGYWSGNVPGARVGEQYRYLIVDNGVTYSKRDPNGRLVTTSTYNVGNSIIYDPTAFVWGNDAAFSKIPLNKMVIYEMHIGTFNAPVPGVPGTFYNAIDKLDHIKSLGATTVEVMPICSSQGLFFSGYGPDDIFAVDNRAYGGPDGFKTFVKACHARGLSVLLDVV